MIKVDQEKCIGCGACVEDCFPNDIVLKEDKAAPLNRTCIKCDTALPSARLMR